ncbi:MAG: M48 family metallopeptidase [Oscillospiraceae bacterium]|nr:M48 family metallopeptidase [Oscillospiraceae bacterium]
MNYKILALVLIGLIFLYQLAVDCLAMASARRKIPENVADVYDLPAYHRWLRYFKEKTRLALLRHIAAHVTTLVIVAFDVYARIANALFPEGIYGAALAVLAADMVISLLYEIPFDYVNDLVIEQKYGFNHMSSKTFLIDQLKSLLVGLILTGGLCCLFILIHQTLGNWLPLAFAGLMLLFVLGAVFLSPFFSKLYNKFEPLPEGTLRDRLTALLTENGCTVKAIYVMDASKRSSKANAYFTGLGRTKTIVLYDTLLEQMNEDEIVAVFAHEMGHNKHRDTLKMYFLNAVNVAIMALLAWGVISIPEIYPDFGFLGVNYGFAFFLMASVGMSFLSPLTGLVFSALSRRFEYGADCFAAERGYGQALISALKKLARNTFTCLTPHPALVALTYSHPTVSQRVAALEQVGGQT